MLYVYLLAMTMIPGRRYTDWRWRVVADYVRRRDGFRCRRCGIYAYTVHHEKPVSEGGSHRPGNLRTLCEDCHAEIHTWLK